MKKLVKESKRESTKTKEVSNLFRQTDWQGLFKYIPDYIAIYDKKGNYEYLNHYARGFSEKETIGKHFSTYLTEESVKIYKKCFNKAVKTKTTQYIQYSAPGDDGAEKWYESYIVPILRNGKFVNMMVVARDISEKKKNRTGTAHKRS